MLYRAEKKQLSAPVPGRGWEAAWPAERGDTRKRGRKAGGTRQLLFNFDTTSRSTTPGFAWGCFKVGARGFPGSPLGIRAGPRRLHH